MLPGRGIVSVEDLLAEVKGIRTDINRQEQTLASVQGDVRHVQSEVTSMKSLVSIKETTTAAANNLLSSHVNANLFEKMFERCTEGEIMACWSHVEESRKAIAAASSESHVQSAIVAVAIECCKDGTLAVHDTHKENYPQHHKIDLCLTPSWFDQLEKVPMSMVAVLGEFKHSFEIGDSLKQVAVQINDRVCAVLNSQGQDRKIVCAIADKSVIRFFFYNPSSSPGPFTSTDTMPFLNKGTSPSLGFTFFYRMCRTALGKLGYPEVPVCPIPGDGTFIVRLRHPPKASVYHIRLQDQTEGVIKVYQQIDDVSQERLAREKEALELFNKSSAPVPILLEFDLAKSYLLLSPYATTLKELDKFNSQTLCAIAGAAASFFRIAKNLDFVHKDISPDNILVCPGNKILINDLGSCHRTEALYDTNGATLLYCCPLFGAHFENNTGGPYSYTLSNDIRALFICLFEFSLPERMVGNVVLSKVLPWERVRQTMQSSKWSFFMSCNWKKTVLPEAVPFLEGLWKEIFVQASWDSGKGTFVINIESVLSLLEALGKQTVISAVK